MMKDWVKALVQCTLCFSIMISDGLALSPTQWIVVFNPAQTHCDAESLLQSLNSRVQSGTFTLVRPYGECGLIVTHPASKEKMSEHLPTLKSLPGFEYIEADQIMGTMMGN